MISESMSYFKFVCFANRFSVWRGEMEDKSGKKLLRSSVYNVFNFLFTATLDTAVNLGSTSFMKLRNQVYSHVVIHGHTHVEQRMS